MTTATKPFCLNFKDHYGAEAVVAQELDLIMIGKDRREFDIVAGTTRPTALLGLNREKAAWLADILDRFARTGVVSAKADAPQIWEEGDKSY